MAKRRQMRGKGGVAENNICKRENLILDIIGTVTDTKRVVVYGKNRKDKIVDLELSNVLGNIPRKKYIMKEVKPNQPYEVTQVTFY